MFTDFCEDYTIPYKTSGHHHCRAGWVQLDCPFCGGGVSGYHLGVEINTGRVACWKCGGKSILKLVEMLTHQPPKPLIRKYHITTQRGYSLEVDDSKQFKRPAPMPLNSMGIKYLTSRGLLKSTIQKFQIQQLPRTFDLYLPIFENGKEVSYVTRSLAKNPVVRYKACPESDSLVNNKWTLYGEWLCQDSPYVIVVEGPFDVLKLGRNAVATYGTAFTPKQICKLLKYKNVFIIGDNDKAGRHYTTLLMDELSKGGIHRLGKYKLPETAKDVADLDHNGIESIHKACTEAL